MTIHDPGAPSKHTRQEGKKNTSHYGNKPDISKSLTVIRRRRLAVASLLKLVANLQARVGELTAENAQLEIIVRAQAQRLGQLQNESGLNEQ